MSDGDKGGINFDNSGCFMWVFMFIAGQLFALGFWLADIQSAIEHLAK